MPFKAKNKRRKGSEPSLPIPVPVGQKYGEYEFIGCKIYRINGDEVKEESEYLYAGVVTFLCQVMTDALCKEFIKAINEFDQNKKVRVIIITGNPSPPTESIFLEGMMQGKIPSYPKYGFEALDTLRAIKKPTIAAVNGPATGMAFELVLTCDIIYASTVATFSLCEIFRQGMISCSGGAATLVKTCGKSFAMEKGLTGDTFNAQTALDKGLISHIFSTFGLLFAETIQLARKIAMNNETSVEFMKKNLNKTYEYTLSEGLKYERNIQVALQRSLEKQNTMKLMEEQGLEAQNKRKISIEEKSSTSTDTNPIEGRSSRSISTDAGSTEISLSDTLATAVQKLGKSIPQRQSSLSRITSGLAHLLSSRESSESPTKTGSLQNIPTEGSTNNEGKQSKKSEKASVPTSTIPPKIFIEGKPGTSTDTGSTNISLSDTFATAAQKLGKPIPRRKSSLSRITRGLAHLLSSRESSESPPKEGSTNNEGKQSKKSEKASVPTSTKPPKEAVSVPSTPQRTSKLKTRKKAPSPDSA